ncbi:hypothetical protein CC86DRAFT_360985 [Ophiobolus disseminans]|uniref:Spherulation-specific family 4 n=1 Tax=Ophiobolus disseminans TaxID=1469910 RepID=A0A6A6ZI02_9PLEO|nr:hypothetical protein CC86DRAFT_360985 [Ophiobolus disseminans]
MDGSVIVPLYVYPSMGAWDPVYDMAALYPRVQFTAIVNVHNGPGEGALPNPEYSHAIETLNSFNNVRTVGYVSTTWCARNLNSVLDEIAAYSFWGEYRDSLAVDGIFVDETPTQYSPESVSYLHTIAQAVHGSNGLKEGFIGRSSFHFGTGGVFGPTRACTPPNPVALPLVVPPPKAQPPDPPAPALVYCKPAIACARG